MKKVGVIALIIILNLIGAVVVVNSIKIGALSSEPSIEDDMRAQVALYEMVGTTKFQVVNKWPIKDIRGVVILSQQEGKTYQHVLIYYDGIWAQIRVVEVGESEVEATEE